MTAQKTGLQKASANGGSLSVFEDIKSFEDAHAMASSLSKSSIIPKTYQGNPENCFIAIEMAKRVGVNPIAVMQNLDIIYDRPGWKSSFVVASINSSPKFATDLRWRFREIGEKSIVWKGNEKNPTKTIKIMDLECIAYSKDDSGEMIEGPPATIEMAIVEGWYTRAGSKWPTMTRLMLQYRSAAFFGRLYVPDILMGMHSIEEVSDIAQIEEADATVLSSEPLPTAQGVNKLNDLLNNKGKPEKKEKSKKPDTAADEAAKHGI